MIMQCKCYKVYEGYIEFNTTQKIQKDKKLVSEENRYKMQTCIYDHTRIMREIHFRSSFNFGYFFSSIILSHFCLVENRLSKNAVWGKWVISVCLGGDDKNLGEIFVWFNFLSHKCIFQ